MPPELLGRTTASLAGLTGSPVAVEMADPSLGSRRIDNGSVDFALLNPNSESAHPLRATGGCY